MPKIALSTYTIRIRQRREANYELIDQFDGRTDLFDIMINYLNDRNQNYSHNANLQKMLTISQFNNTNRIIQGIINSGEYGYETELYDINNNNISYRRSVNEAELLPFFFQIYLPNNSNEGILILQRFGQFGIRKIFTNDFNLFFLNLFPDYIIDINPLLPSQIVNEHLRNGIVTKIRFVKFEVPEDIADAYGNDGNIEEIKTTELVITAKRNHFLSFFTNRITDFLRNREVQGLIELTNFEYDTIKIEVRLNNEVRTIDLSDLNKLRAYFDITNEVQIDADGHPNFDSILENSNNLLQNLISYLEGNTNE